MIIVNTNRLWTPPSFHFDAVSDFLEDVTSYMKIALILILIAAWGKRILNEQIYITLSTMHCNLISKQVPSVH